MRFSSLFKVTVGGLAAVGVAVMSPAQAAPIFNPLNGHYYDTVQSAGIGWFAAQSAASALSHAGQGHLVTITSAAEQNFIVTNLPQALGTIILSATGSAVCAQSVAAIRWLTRG